MFCGQCGSEMPETAQFCSACGAPLKQGAAASAGWQSTPDTPRMQPGGVNRLQRPRQDRMIAGVCAGLAQHYGWELPWVRLATVLITIFSSGAGLIAYVVFWIVMPEQLWALPSTVGDRVPPQY